MTPHPTGVRAPAREALALRGLSKRFGDREVLADVDITVEPGRIVALLGRSGSGKTTILRIIAGLETASGGDLTLGGSVAVVFQEARLIPNLRVWHNVVVGAAGADGRTRAEGLLAEVGLSARTSDWPHSLSGGEAQRVGVARALSYEPDFLLLDEPFAALDALTRLEMQALLLRLRDQHGFGALLVTHDVEEAISLADTIVVLEDGRISKIEHVDLPQPRSRSHPEFLRTEHSLLRQLGVDADQLHATVEGAPNGR